MKVTLGDARASHIPESLDVCGIDTRLVTWVNEAQLALLHRGKIWGFFQKIRICTSDRCITTPREVANLEDVAVDGRVTHPRNDWYEWLEYQPRLCRRLNPSCSTVWQDWGWAPFDSKAKGTSPMFKDISGPGNFLRLYCGTTDVGKKVLLKGYDANGVWIRTDLGGGIIGDGIYYTLALPFVDTMEISAITSAQKPVTDQVVRVYQVTTIGGNEIAVAVWGATETIPDYRRYELPASCCNSSCPNGVRTITAMAKLEFQPAIADTDILMTGNLLAIEYMAMSIKSRRSNLGTKAKDEEVAALRELNMELNHYDGNPNALPIGLKPFGSAKLSHQRIGTLV